MYTGKLILTNKQRTPFALSNNFDDTFGLVDAVKKCESAKEFCNVANKYHYHKYKWSIDCDSDEDTRLVYKDVLGNVKYLIATKEEQKASSVVFLVYEKNYLCHNDVDCVEESDMKLYYSKKSAMADMRNRKKKYIEGENNFTFMENESTDDCYIFADELGSNGEDRSGEFHICIARLEVN